MSRPIGTPRGLVATMLLGVLTVAMVSQTQAQQMPTNKTAPLNVDRSLGRVELIAKTSRLLQFEYDVPTLVVDNQNIVRATPIAADKVLLTALKPGIATISVNDSEGRIQTIDVVVQGDVRALELALGQLYPNSNIKATALETGVALSGTLARASDVEGALNIATEYFPQVHNYLRLPDSQLIAIEVQIYEVARSKVRQLGIDWNLATDNLTLNVAGAANPTNNLSFSVINNGNSLNGFLQALERQNLAKLLDKPLLVAQNGRPAEFLEGGELPFQVAAGFGQTSIEFRPFGTKLDVVPIVQGEGFVRLEVRAEVSEPSQDLANNTGVAGFRVRRVNTGVDMKVGHTLALAGDIREEVEATTSGIPGLRDTPYLGALFRRVEETRSEIELIMLLTPRFIGEVDPSLLPPTMLGQTTTSPSNCELYLNGHIEVPRCGPECGGLATQHLDGGGWQYQQGHPAAPGAAPVWPQGAPMQPAQPPQQQSLPPVVKPDSVSGFGYPGANRSARSVPQSVMRR